ncbi:Oidioi.mRNA.OKI2018_I69.XSR.g15227.t1.cds [Oikopleura dioica]|uniref:Oidioi.mRNA.OKI2018_I69.XSR.g15227.t1.cds n=1 Tax=Oikopleura dioica TaxID=34765 RepID=A0ABN7SC62_OIKDI|nr:Oidioi.mRNA.OKI2018_I69.XSR.g15227.t1.cds [Oikopleura dioica]
MPRYRITTELSDEEIEPYVPKPIKKKSDEERFGEQTIPGLGLYTIPKMRTDEERAKMMEEDEEIAAHVPLSSRKWYRDSLATADLCLVEPASLADPNASRVTPRRSRIHHVDYDQLQVNYEPAKPSKSLYGFSKGRSVEDSLKEIREEKAAIKAAKSERLRREWIGTAPKAKLGAPSEKDACLYSINDYLEVQKAQEAKMEAREEEELFHHKPFKTAKQIRAEKYGVDEDEEGQEILNAKINVPRRKQHEIGTSVDELFDRHKSLVTSVLDRRTEKIRRARAVRKEGEEEIEDLLNVNVRSPKWLAQASSPSGLYEDQFKKRLPLKLDTLEDLLNYNPHGQIETTTAEEDAEALKKLAPKEYKTFENPNFLRSSFKHLYSDPMANLNDDKYKKLMKDVTFTTAQFPPSRLMADEDE